MFNSPLREDMLIHAEAPLKSSVAVLCSLFRVKKKGILEH